MGTPRATSIFCRARFRATSVPAAQRSFVQRRENHFGLELQLHSQPRKRPASFVQEDISECFSIHDGQVFVCSPVWSGFWIVALRVFVQVREESFLEGSRKQGHRFPRVEGLCRAFCF